MTLAIRRRLNLKADQLVSKELLSILASLTHCVCSIKDSDNSSFAYTQSFPSSDESDSDESERSYGGSNHSSSTEDDGDGDEVEGNDVEGCIWGVHNLI